MIKNLMINEEVLDASLEGMLVIEHFLNENYRFRRNILNGKVEFATTDLDFRPLTPEALNSIIIRAKREQVMEKGSPKTEITEYVQSEEVPVFNPILSEIIMACFRKPEEGEKAVAMNSGQIIASIQNEFPSVKSNHSTKVHLGLAMKELEFEHSDRGHVAYYKVIPLQVA